MNTIEVNVGELPHRFPHFSKPSIRGFFSLNKNREYEPTIKHLSYLYYDKHNSKVDFDLNSGYDKVIKKPDCLSESEMINHLLHYILQNVHKHAGKDKFLSTDFICYRGLLTEIMYTPYNLKDDWIICAIQWKKNIYLCAFDTEEKKQRILSADDRERKFCSWGYKFEQYMTTDFPGKQPKTNVPVCEPEEFSCVFETRLNGKKILYGAEMDAIDSDIPINPETLCSNSPKFIELKTNRKIENRKQDRIFQRYKWPKWWCQSFLVGIEDIFCGFRNDAGIVEEIVHFCVNNIPKKSEGLWNASVCMNFCENFLNRVTTITSSNSDDPSNVWKFHYIASEQKIIYEKIIGPSGYSFLPAWYIENAEKLSQNKSLDIPD